MSHFVPQVQCCLESTQAVPAARLPYRVPAVCWKTLRLVRLWPQQEAGEAQVSETLGAGGSSGVKANAAHQSRRVSPHLLLFTFPPVGKPRFKKHRAG